jgi:hypothetical protein
MPLVRYYLISASTERDPLELGCIASSGYINVEEQESTEATDRLAFLLATSETGELLELMHFKEGRTVWCEGMAIPGTKITADMVGMTFSEAVKLSMKK